MEPATVRAWIAGVAIVLSMHARADERPYGIERRVPWTTSRVTGAPEPPPPFQTRRVFEQLTFKQPVDLAVAPGSNRWFVAEQGGRLYSFKPNPAEPDLLIDMTKDVNTLDRVPESGGVGGVYGFTFHPEFAVNRYLYVFYVLSAKKPGTHLSNGTRVSRFTLSDTDPPRAIPESEVVIIEWLEGGHNGGCVKFGPDGFLYITTGDATDPSPPDSLKTGQDLSDLLSSILRIDVDHPDGERVYSIPADNPFVGVEGARPEVWAYGFRNPWRISFDRATGELWAGDVGWETWELVHRVKRGGNYGWSVVEGPQTVDPGGKRGPTPILPPAIAIPHPEGASVTGGYVYRGKRFPELTGHYIFGDWDIRPIWASPVEGRDDGQRRAIARNELRPIAFAEDHEGELYILDYEGGGIHELAPSATEWKDEFPKRLSETGLFASTATQTPAPGVTPFSINAPQWADGATAQRWVAVPGEGRIEISDRRSPLYPGQHVEFAKDAVLAKTFTLGGRRIETQLLHFDGRNWNGYSYAWDEDQRDAELVEAAGRTRIVQAPGDDLSKETLKQVWNYPARTQCATCHNPWARYTLAFNEAQLSREQDYGGVRDEQLRTLSHIGLAPREWADRGASGQTKALADPHDPAASLDHRARSYLHANCAHCHQFGGGGAAVIDLRHDLPLKDTRTVDGVPVQGTFGIPNGRIVTPGDPYRSVLLYRMARLGPGRMPHIGSHRVDLRGVGLIEHWIASLGPPNSRSTEPSDPMRSLSSTDGALSLVRAIDRGEVSGRAREAAIAAGLEHPSDAVRGLFERFSTAEPRADLLGDAIDTKKLLAMPGDAERGRKVFFESAAGATCRTCHRVRGVGGAFGPDLSMIGAKYSRGELLEHIAEPSKRTDEPFVLQQIFMKDGAVRAGFITERTSGEIALQEAGGQRSRIASDKVARIDRQPLSAMPPLLLRSMTAQEAADLLSFLASLR